MYQKLENAVNQWPENVFLIRENITFEEFPNYIRARATTLREAGVKAGDTVGLLSHNLPEFVSTLFAIWYLGARVLLLDTNLTPTEYDNMTDLTNCKLVCAEKSFFYDAVKFKFFDIQTKDEKTDEKLKAYPLKGDDIATLSFTSGSTGIPKIVPLTHDNLVSCSEDLESLNIFLHPGEMMYAFLPLYHVFGFAVGFLAPLHFGMGILLQSTINPNAILQDFAQYKPHVIPAVPKLWEIFRKKIIDGVKAKKKWGLVSFIMNHQKTLRFLGLGKLVDKVLNQIRAIFGGRAHCLVAGGAATKPEVEKFYNQLGMNFVQGYGMTETVGPICCSKPVKKRVAYAFGAPLGGSECQIRNAGEDGIGMLWVRGKQVFGGYLNNDDANKECFDKDGFFCTGDLVSIDKNGEYHFAGRKKQVIVLDSGKNVYPDELEALFLEIDGVKNVAVFEHEVNNKTVAYGVFSVEEGMTMEKLAAAIAEQNKKVASYKWVTHFAMTTDDLPMTSTQKVKHHMVRQNLIDGKYTNKHE
ncbi:MAG: AMP-binding protein, partial [Alphaproteobacteria bacterium]|nr:AMP-binding protein [Alphaproteobacteria bacterium]